MKKIILVVSGDTSIRNGLQQALPNFLVTGASKIDAVNTPAQAEMLAAAVFHLIEMEDWLMYEFFRTGYPEVPAFCVIGFEDKMTSQELVNIAQERGAQGIINEPEDSGINFNSLASMLEAHLLYESENSKDIEKNLKDVSWLVLREMRDQISRLENELFEAAEQAAVEPQFLNHNFYRHLYVMRQRLSEIFIIPPSVS